MRRAKVDSTHKSIRDTLRACGWEVVNVSTVKGFIDMVAWHNGRQQLVLIDAKSPKGRRTEAQDKLVAAGWPIHFIESVEQALALSTCLTAL